MALEIRLTAELGKSMYEPTKNDREALYGKIDIYNAEKSFAAGKCCMCCK